MGLVNNETDQLYYAGTPIHGKGREFCHGENYWCEVGHCCGNGECCTYYYELWWFWLVWFLIVFVIGFCVWQRKRLCMWRTNQQCRNRSNYLCGPPELYPDILPIPPVKLPAYADIEECPTFSTPPPPYTCECFFQGAALVPASSFAGLPPTEGDAPPSYHLLPINIIAPLLPRLHVVNNSGNDTSPNTSVDNTDNTNNEPNDSDTVTIEVPTCRTPCLSCRNSPRLIRVPRNHINRSSSAVSVSSQCVNLSSPQTADSDPASISSSSGLLRSNNSVVNISVHSLCGGEGTQSQLLRPLLLPSTIHPHHHHSCPAAQNPSLQSRSFALSCNLADELSKTLPCLIPQSNSRNQEPDRFVRRNSNSLPRNFACNGHQRNAANTENNTSITIEEASPESSPTSNVVSTYTDMPR